MGDTLCSAQLRLSAWPRQYGDAKLLSSTVLRKTLGVRRWAGLAWHTMNSFSSQEVLYYNKEIKSSAMTHWKASCVRHCRHATSFRSVRRTTCAQHLQTSCCSHSHAMRHEACNNLAPRPPESGILRTSLADSCRSGLYRPICRELVRNFLRIAPALPLLLLDVEDLLVDEALQPLEVVSQVLFVHPPLFCAI